MKEILCSFSYIDLKDTKDIGAWVALIFKVFALKLYA